MTVVSATRDTLDAVRPSRLSCRSRRALGVLTMLAVMAVLAAILAGKRDEFERALKLAPVWLLIATAALQLVASVARSEAWVACVHATGSRVSRRRLYRASSASFAGGILTGSLAAAARVAALRRTAPADAPRIPALIAAELPIVAFECALGAIFSFTLVGPLGLPWWAPLVGLAVIGSIVYGLRRAAAFEGKGREFWKGLAALRCYFAAGRVFLFTGVALLAQIARNYMILHALGVHASVFDAIAVLIALAVLGMLPVGPSVGAAATVLILGPHSGVALVAAVGVLLTATATAGSLVFAIWGATDQVLDTRRRRHSTPVPKLAPALAELPAPLA